MIGEVIQKIINEYGAILIKCQIPDHKSISILKIVVDTIEGITINQISEISRLIMKSDEINQLLSTGFRLEVTSPGLEHPLTEMFQFERNMGRKLRIFHSYSDVQSPIEGVLKSFTKEILHVQTPKNEYKLPYSNIKYGKIILQ